jgi:NAD(P)-dependent dehydrogenase (short-subunit alcohol dehydrogenase family)
MGLHERVAVVTGAGSGIGRASALALLKDGYRVVLAGRRAERLEAVAKEAGPLAQHALAVPTDVTDPASVRRLFARTKDAFRHLDVLFNNAGRSSPPVPFEDITYDQWRSVVDVNLNGMFLCAQEALRMMKSQSPRGGRIINNGSISAHAPRPHSAPYTATKHAVTGLTKCIALDGREHDIACSQIDVGNALTDLSAKMATGVPQADGSMRPEPLMDVAHVASTVLYIANLPGDANVLFTTIMATKMPFVGRG